MMYLWVCEITSNGEAIARIIDNILLIETLKPV